MSTFPATYGEVLKPLDVAALPDYLQDLYRAEPLFREWLHLHDKVRRAEKVSSWTQWTHEQSAAYEAGDYVQFSRLRGYTEDEIADFLHSIELLRALERHLGDPDFVAVACYEADDAVRTPARDAIDRELIRLADGA